MPSSMPSPERAILGNSPERAPAAASSFMSPTEPKSPKWDDDAPDWLTHAVAVCSVSNTPTDAAPAPAPAPDASAAAAATAPEAVAAAAASAAADIAAAAAAIPAAAANGSPPLPLHHAVGSGAIVSAIVDGAIVGAVGAGVPAPPEPLLLSQVSMYHPSAALDSLTGTDLGARLRAEFRQSGDKLGPLRHARDGARDPSLGWHAGENSSVTDSVEADVESLLSVDSASVASDAPPSFADVASGDESMPSTPRRPKPHSHGSETQVTQRRPRREHARQPSAAAGAVSGAGAPDSLSTHRARLRAIRRESRQAAMEEAAADAAAGAEAAALSGASVDASAAANGCAMPASAYMPSPPPSSPAVAGAVVGAVVGAIPSVSTKAATGSTVGCRRRRGATSAPSAGVGASCAGGAAGGVGGGHSSAARAGGASATQAESLYAELAISLKDADYAGTVGRLGSHELRELRATNEALLRLDLFLMVVAHTAAKLPRYCSAIETHVSMGVQAQLTDADTLALRLGAMALRTFLSVLENIKKEADDMATKLDSWEEREAAAARAAAMDPDA